ncbi:MAG: transporter substrate-binding domain-containing protein [Clostridia bacterium]|nr:transporter substrate-binding domain-containing protein [Clostridia bacterium]
MYFSDYPEGKDTYWIYAAPHREDLLTKDTRKLNGCKIGVTRGSYQEGLLQDYLQEKEIQCEVVGCSGFDEMMRRLDESELDAMVAPDLSTSYGYKIISILGYSDYYFAVSRQRPDILEELNEALYEIQTAEPEYNSLLANRYYYKVASGLILNEAEETWLREHNHTIRMGCLANYLPFIGQKDGSYVGVIMTVIDTLKSEYGVDVILSTYPDLDTMKIALRAGEIDLIGPVVGDFYLAEQDKFVLTDAIVQTTPVVFYQGTDYLSSLEVIAATDQSVFNPDIVHVLFPDAQVMVFDTTDGCLEAVASGKAGSTIVPAARINIVRRNSATDDMAVAEMTNRLDIRLIATKPGRRAATITNKAILHSSAALGGLVMAENSTPDNNLVNFLKKYSWHLLGIIVFVMLVLLYLSISLLRSRKKMAKALTAANDAKAAAEEFNTQLKTHLEIINSVAGVFFSLYYIDM